jgi:hypothetical protein
MAAAEITDNPVLATLYRILAAMRREYVEGRPPGVLQVGKTRAIQLTGIRRADRAYALLERLPAQVPGLSVTRDTSPWQEFGEPPAEVRRIEWPDYAELLEPGAQRKPSVGSEENRAEQKRAEEKRTEKTRRETSRSPRYQKAPSAPGFKEPGNSAEMNRDLSTMIRKIDEAGIKIDESRFFAGWPTLHAQIVSRQLSMQGVMELARAGKWTPSETT